MLASIQQNLKNLVIKMKKCKSQKIILSTQRVSLNKPITKQTNEKASVLSIRPKFKQLRQRIMLSQPIENKQSKLTFKKQVGIVPILKKSYGNWKSCQKTDLESPKKTNTLISFWKNKKQENQLNFNFNKIIDKLFPTHQGCSCQKKDNKCEIRNKLQTWANKDVVFCHYQYEHLKNVVKQILKEQKDKQNAITHYHPQKIKLFNQIKKDVLRTHPFARQFQTKNISKSTQYVLMAYCIKDSQIGYIQGMNSLIAGIIYHIKEQSSTFHVFFQFMKKIRKQYLQNFKGIYSKVNTFINIFTKQYPQLKKHLDNFSLDLLNLFFPMFLTLYTSVVPLQSVHHIYIGFLEQGWEYIYKISLQLLQEHKQKLLQFDDEGQFMQFFSISKLVNCSINWKVLLQKVQKKIL